MLGTHCLPRITTSTAQARVLFAGVSSFMHRLADEQRIKLTVDALGIKKNTTMRQPRLEYHTTRMWISVLLAIGYSSAFLFFYTLTGSTTLDGIVGILLGLYVGAHPAAHLIDLLYLPHGTRHELLSSEQGLVWLVVNILVVVVGILTIVIGANRFVQPARDASLSLLSVRG
jgi:hypothetical protein